MFTPPPPHTTRPDLTGTFGMAASTHWVATGVAQSVLERGGNAFDAAAAAGFVLHLVEPHLNGPGGDMVALVAPADDGLAVVCGQGPAPAGASIEHYRSSGLDSVPGAGALAAAVPGAVEAWLWMLREHGTWDVAEVLGYAVEYAEHGLPLGRRVSETIARMAPLFREHWPTSAATWLLPDGGVPAPGTVLGNPAYARTLRRLIATADASGSDRAGRIDAVLAEWKTGFVARAVADFAAVPHRHSDGRDHAGVITVDDMASFEVTTEPTVHLDFRGYTVHKAGFWSQGPVLLQTLAILDRLDEEAIDPSTERGVHTVVEALKLAMADRDAYYGDTRTDDTPLAALLTEEYAEQRAALIGDTASAEFRPGTVGDLSPYLPPLPGQAATGAAPSAGEPTVDRNGTTKGDTVHLDVVDRWGNLVSATPSGGWLQSNPTIPELGFCLGTRLQMTWLDPASPSALMPGRRPRTTLSPTLLSRDGVVVSALGTPGGDQQDQWQLLYLLRTLVGGYTPQQAIDAPMFDTTGMAQSFWPRLWTPRGVEVEERIGDSVVDGLRRRGHDVTVTGPWTLGRVSAVSRDPATGILSAAANPRGGQGYASGR